jgi:hypothetical protein
VATGARVKNLLLLRSRQEAAQQEPERRARLLESDDAERDAMITDFKFDRAKHEFSIGGVRRPSITQVLAASGICDFSFVAEDVRIHAMNRGKSVHWMLQLEDEGLLNYRKVPRSLLGYRRAYKTWKENSGFVPLLIEKPMASALGYCGIPDRYGKLPLWQHVVVEFKTGAIAEWTRFQLAAQCVLIQPNISLARTIRRIGLSLLPDGDYKVKEFPLASFDSDISRFIEELRKMNGNYD